MTWTSESRAKKAYFHARKHVPAYRKFTQSFIDNGLPVPETDKSNYITKYSMPERCLDGEMGRHWHLIDESSGSTGQPFNWIRSARERRESHYFISYFARYCFGSEPWITLNAFSMGAWATGLNMGIALQRNSLVKNTGPDMDKIIQTIEYFGKEYQYLILGYPPFLKHLIDYANTKSFQLSDYRLMALVGGEGMSEGLRDYLLPVFKKVYSGYGATDLEIGMSGETPVAVAIRRLARNNKEVRVALFGEDPRLPMLFQYNPLMHYLELNAQQELVCTITRTSLLSPRIRYNVHDEGGLARYDEMADKLRILGFDIDEMSVAAGGRRKLRLPFLWIYGRKDATISVMGANIYPEDIEQCVYGHAELATYVRSYCLSLSEDEKSNVHPLIMLELNGTVFPPPSLDVSEIIRSGLFALNADYREAYAEYPDALMPVVHFHAEGTGPFVQDHGRIKQRRLLPKMQ